MTYCYTDFAILHVLSSKKGRGLGDMMARIALTTGFAFSEEVVRHGLTALYRGGYVQLDKQGSPFVVDTSTAVTLTEKGKKAVSIPLLKRLFGQTGQVLRDREAAFLIENVPDGADVALAPHLYEQLCASIQEPEDNGPECLWLKVSRSENGIRLFVHEPWAAEDDEDEQAADENDDSSSLNGSAQGPDLAALVGGAGADDEYTPPNRLSVTYAADDPHAADILFAVRDLACSDELRTRKASLYDGADTCVLTLSPQLDGIRVTCAPVRFNRNRFRGKRDALLDYAQCGDDLVRFTLDLPFLSQMTAAAYAEVWDYLATEAKEALHELHRAYP